MLNEFSNATTPIILNQHIKDYLLIEKTELCPADVILVFGNKHCINKLAKRAASLYNQGYASKIIASGGQLLETNISEANAIKHSILSYGVRDEDIFVEDQSTNTQENVVNSKEMIESHFPNQNIKRVIGIATIVAGRRFLMTLLQNWDGALHMVSNVNPFDTSTENFITNPKFQKVAEAEYLKIKPYINNGFIQEVNLNHLNQKISSCLETACQLELSNA